MAFPHDGKKFEPGQSGNPSGRPKGHRNARTILEELVNLPMTVVGDDGNEDTVTRYEYMLAGIVKRACDGNSWDIDRVIDRLEGKATQPTDNKTELSGGLTVTKVSYADK